MRFSFRRASLAALAALPCTAAAVIAGAALDREAEPPSPVGPPPVVVEPFRTIESAAPHPDRLASNPSLAFSPDGRDLAAGWSESDAPIVSVWDATTGRRRWRASPPVSEPFSVAFSRDGSSIAVGPSTEGGSASIKLYDARTGEERPTTWKSVAPVSYYQRLAFSPDGRRLAVTRLGRVWWFDKAGDAPPWEARFEPRDSRELFDLAFSPDGRYVAAAGDGPMGGVGFSLLGFSHWSCGVRGGVVGLWDAATGKKLLDLRTRNPARAVAVSPDGATLASGDLKGLRLWSLADGRGRWVLSGHVVRLVYSPDGRFLALLIRNGSVEATPHEVRIWDVAAGRVRAVLRGAPANPRALAVSADGSAVLVAGDGGLVRWDFEPARD